MNSYRENALFPFKEEVERLRKDYLDNREAAFQKELEEIKEQIKIAAGSGAPYFEYRVDELEIRFWPFFKNKPKRGTKAERVVNKLIELGFTPDIKSWGPIRIHFEMKKK